MAGRPQVSIRLGTTGRADVEKDFAAIGDSGDAQARRYQASWERATAEVEGALDRQAKAAARLEAVGATPVQQRINAATGVGAVQSGTAKAAASALATELDRAESEARQLIAAIDPLFAAQARYEAQIERINAVRATGQLTEERYQQLLAHEKVLLDESTAAGARNAGMRGQQRMGMQQLGFQLGDISTQMAMGTRASIIFAQQSGQTIQALQQMGGEGNKFLAFLRGPWGIGLSVAAIALTPLIGKLFDAGESIDDLVEKLKKEARQQEDNDRAHQLFAETLEGVRQTIRDVEKAYADYENRLKTSSQAELDAAKNALALAIARRAEAKAALDAAAAEIERQNALAIGPETKSGRPDPRLVAADEARKRIIEAQSQLGLADSDIERAQQAIEKWQSIVTVERASADEVERIRQKFEGPDGLIEKTRRRMLAEHKVGDELERQVKALKDQEAAQIKAAQERERKTPANAGGTAIFNDQIASFFDIANKYRGLSESKDRLTLKTFLGDVDPEKTAWCAAFVNAVLAAGGVHGTGSLAASSFLNFGKDDTKSPQKGDIAVVKSGGSPSGQHVGFVQSVDAKGNVTVLGGNTGDKVATSTYSASQVLAIRRPPTPSESAAASDKAESDALQATRTFDSEREKLNQQYLQALAKVVRGYDEQSAVQLMRAQGEHDAEAKEIAANLAAGKYGDATSELAQTRAKQLQEANDQVLSERKAAIALEDQVKALQSQDAANERDAQYRLDALEYQKSTARTADQRRKLQQEIVDVEYKEKEAHLKTLLAIDLLLGNTEDAAKVMAELAHLPEEKKRDKEKGDRDNQSPLQEYYNSLPQNMAQAGEVMQNDVVSALKNLNEGLDDALLKSKNFHELWKNMKSVVHDFAASLLKDLIDLTIKMFIIKPLLQMLGLGTATPGFATGTEYFPGGTAWVGEHGPELVRLPRGSKIHTAADSRRMAAANDMGPMIGSLTIAADFRGADAQAVDAINGRLDLMEQELPGKIVSTMADARDRFVWRGR